MDFVGIVWILAGLACMRLGRYLDRLTFGTDGEAFAAGILMRIVGAALIAIGALRLVGRL